MQLLLESALLEPSEALNSWHAYLKTHDLQTVGYSDIALFPLVYHNLKEKSHPLCKSAYRHTWLTNQTLWAKTLPILNKFLDAGIEKVALLKGMALILHHYHNFGVRLIGDIDILIDRSHVPLAYSLLINSGWQCQLRRLDPHNSGQLSRWHAANFTHPDGMNLDLHWSLLTESNPALDQEVLKAVPPGIQPLSPTDLLFQTCVHGYKKSTAPLIRWVPDALTLLKLPIDFTRLFHLAQTAKLTLPLSEALNYLKTNFNAAIPPLLPKPTFLEIREFNANLRGNLALAEFYRSRLNKRPLLRYLQHTASLPTVWHVPLYAPYWVLKRIYRLLKKGISVFQRKSS